MAKTKSEQPESSGLFVPDEVTRDDFFRLRRVGNCWQVEMVRVKGDRVEFRRGVYAEDILPNSRRRLERYTIEAERER